MSIQITDLEKLSKHILDQDFLPAKNMTFTSNGITHNVI